MFNFLKYVFNPSWFVSYFGDDSGGTPTSTTTTSYSYPPELQGKVIDLAQKAADAANTDYISYTKQRIQGFDPFQLTAQQAVANLGPAQQLGAATQFAGAAGMRAGDINYVPMAFGNQFQAPQAYQGGIFGLQNVAAPYLQNYQMEPAQNVAAQKANAEQMAAAQTQFDSRLQQYQMQQAKDIATGTFTRPGTAQEYMSPYQQSVTDIEKREAIRQSDIAKQQQQAQAVQSGAYGGTRQAIVEAERQRNLGTQLGDIQAKGSQAAFQQAQAQFNAEQQAKLQAQMANQQAAQAAAEQNLQAKLGVQQLGTQTGLQAALANLTSQQQANVQNQAAKLQMEGLNAQQALQAALANQQAGLTVGQQNLAARLGVQQLGAGQSLQAQLANQQAMQEAQRMQEMSRQFGYGQQMNAAQLAAQYGLSGQQATEASRQFGANLSLQGLQQQLAAAQTLGGLGSTQFGQQKDIINALQSAGQQRQALEQQYLTQEYEDFLRQKQYPYQQLAYAMEMIKGAPQQTTQQIYQAPPSTTAQLAGLGTAMYGASRFFAGGGLADLAVRHLSKG